MMYGLRKNATFAYAIETKKIAYHIKYKRDGNSNQ
jgi:hypothetical protein